MKLARIIVAVGIIAACGPPRQTTTADRSDRESGAGPEKEPGAAVHPRKAECTLARAGCHDVGECKRSGLCEAAPPSSDYGCGIPPRQVEDCKADPDCKGGEVCNAFHFGCEVGHRCEARCQTAGCQEGWQCGADGRCAPRRCPDEWSCADYGDCRPPAPGEGPLQGGRDWHGCVPFSCASDAECPCAHCVSGRCSPIPGRCIEPRG